MKAKHLPGNVGIRNLLLPFVSAKPPMITDRVAAVNSDESEPIFIQIQNVILNCLL